MEHSTKYNTLPINLQKDLIIQKVKENQVTLIQGETGSGKTTQVPQIIFESRILPKKMVIGITQPRRVAAISLAMRVYSEVIRSIIIDFENRWESRKAI